jgi:hypothetical protein
MICPTCNNYPLTHPKGVGPDGPFTLSCTGCKKAPDKCGCDHTISMDAHVAEALK